MAASEASEVEVESVFPQPFDLRLELLRFLSPESLHADDALASRFDAQLQVSIAYAATRLNSLAVIRKKQELGGGSSGSRSPVEKNDEILITTDMIVDIVQKSPEIQTKMNLLMDERGEQKLRVKLEAKRDCVIVRNIPLWCADVHLWRLLKEKAADLCAAVVSVEHCGGDVWYVRCVGSEGARELCLRLQALVWPTTWIKKGLKKKSQNSIGFEKEESVQKIRASIKSDHMVRSFVGPDRALFSRPTSLLRLANPVASENHSSPKVFI